MRLSTDHFKKLNQGDGIFYAPEEFVRDTISHQIIETGLFKTHEIDNENSSYVIDEEYKIELEYAKLFALAKKDADLRNIIELYGITEAPKAVSKNFYIDIVFKRIQPENLDKTLTIPCLIEAKRYNLASIDPVKAIFPYLLIWGKGNPDFSFKPAFETLKNKKYINFEEVTMQIMPTKWNEERILEHVWVALLPVHSDICDVKHYNLNIEIDGQPNPIVIKRV